MADWERLAQQLREEATGGNLNVLEALRQGGYSRVPTAILRSDLTPGAKLVYFALADRCRIKGGGRIWPKMATLATATGLSERQVGRAVAKLRDRGLIDTSRRGMGMSNTYTLLAPEWVISAVAKELSARLDRAASADTDGGKSGHSGRSFRPPAAVSPATGGGGSDPGGRVTLLGTRPGEADPVEAHTHDGRRGGGDGGRARLPEPDPPGGAQQDGGLAGVGSRGPQPHPAAMPAQYWSSCRSCGYAIQPGMWIMPGADGKAEHVECRLNHMDFAQTHRRHRQRCESCKTWSPIAPEGHEVALAEVNEPRRAQLREFLAEADRYLARCTMCGWLGAPKKSGPTRDRPRCETIRIEKDIR